MNKKILMGGLAFIIALSFTQTAFAADASLAITVVSPNGGEVFEAGKTYNITWDSTNIDMVSIGWSTGPGSLNWIAYNIPNTGSYAWKVPVDFRTYSAASNYKIVIIGYQVGVGSATDESDAYFSIIPPKTDLDVLKACLFQPIGNSISCTKADFNGDGFVNFADLAQMNSALKYDVSGDGIIDLTSTSTNADMNFIKGCLYQSTSINPSCTKADFNSDGIVNMADLAAFKGAIKYDLTGDMRVTYIAA